MKGFERTFWKYSFKAIFNKAAPNYKFFAVVKEYRKNAIAHLLCWEIEINSNGIRHPYYGIIPYEYLKEYDLFTPGDNFRKPTKEISVEDEDYECIGLEPDFSKYL
jgi:hypothetical protein